MSLGDRAGDEEPEPGSRLRAAFDVGAPELLEDSRLLVARDPRPTVSHRDPHRPVRRCGRDAHLTALRRVLDRVLDQVPEHLPKPGTVAADRRERSSHRGDDRHFLLREHRRLDGLVDDATQIDLVEAIAERPRLDARRVEDVADELGQPRRLVADERKKRLALSRRQHPPPVLQCPGGADHCRHRAAQLVRDERHEVGAKLRQARELLDASPLGLVGADVLDGGRNEATQQRDELDLVRAEGVRTVARQAQHPDRARADQQRRHELAAQPERKKLLVGRGIAFGQIAAHDELALLHPLQQGAFDRVAVPRRENLACAPTGRGHRGRGVSLDEDDRRSLEGDKTPQLADERPERLVELE